MNLDNPAVLAWVYETVLREAITDEELYAWLDEQTLPRCAATTLAATSSGAAGVRPKVLPAVRARASPSRVRREVSRRSSCATTIVMLAVSWVSSSVLS